MEEMLEYLSDPQVCADLLRAVLWEDRMVRCPVCGSDDVVGHRRYQTHLNRHNCLACSHARGVGYTTFTERTGTVFEHSKLPLDQMVPDHLPFETEVQRFGDREPARDHSPTTAQETWNLLDMSVYGEYDLQLAAQFGGITCTLVRFAPEDREKG